MEENIELQGVIRELLSGTPSADIQLVAAWNGLSVETQMFVLKHLGPNTPKGVFDQAVNSPNEYIRYLALQRVKDNDLVDKERLKYKSDLIQYLGKSIDDVSFCDLSLEQQIIVISNCRYLPCLNLVPLLKNLIEHKNMSQSEIDLLLIEYLKNVSVIRVGDKERTLYQSKENLRVLWKFVVTLNQSELSDQLVALLPVKSKYSYDSEYLESDFLLNLDHSFLAKLLNRKDLTYSGLRKKIFFSLCVDYDEQLRSAAGSNYLHISDSDFEKFINDGIVAKIIPILLKYEINYLGLDPVYIQYFEYYSIKHSSSINMLEANINSKYMYADDCTSYKPFTRSSRSFLDRHCVYIDVLRDQDSDYVRNSLVRLGIFQLAEEAVYAKSSGDKSSINCFFYDLPVEMHGHRFLDSIVKDDVWKTFIEFNKLIYGSNYSDKSKYFEHGLNYWVELYLINKIDDDLLRQYRIPKYLANELFSNNNLNPEHLNAKINYLYHDISYLKDVASRLVESGKRGLYVMYIIIGVYMLYSIFKYIF